MAIGLRAPYSAAEAGQGITVIHFTGRNGYLDEANTRHVQQQLMICMEEPGHHWLFFDFVNIAYVSGAALGMLVGVLRLLRSTKRRMTVFNVNPQIYEVFTLAGLDGFLDLRPVECGNKQTDSCLSVSSPTGVLVVDDDAAVRGLLSFGLEREGHEVWSAVNGRQAIELYRRNIDRIAAVLLDVLMPGMTGPQTLAALQDLCPTVQCCFMSGNASLHTEKELLAIGAVHVFRKPFGFNELFETLNQVVSRQRRNTQDVWIEMPPRESAHASMDTSFSTYDADHNESDFYNLHRRS
jgi:anti-anti-sigma factor